jgi:hypothetical protein
MPRSLLRWARTFAVEAEISDQDLALRVFDWYVRTDRYPPNKEDAHRDWRGFLVLTEPLPGLGFGPSSDQIREAFEILVERHTKYGGPLGATGSDPNSSDRAAVPTLRRRLKSTRLPTPKPKRGRAGH